MTRLLFVHALSPLHAGTGQSTGSIELAIARDRATGFPYLPGTSLKGTLRDEVRRNVRGADIVALFGPETNNASDHAGALVFGDANLLLLPVRSVAGTFAWVTSPYLLRRFARDAVETGVNAALEIVNVVPGSAYIAVGEPDGKEKSVLDSGAHVVFEDLNLEAERRVEVDSLAITLGKLLFPAAEDESWRTMLRQRLCLVDDDVMSFLATYATDVVTRVAIDDEKKTVKKGQLWREESLPVESVLVAAIACIPSEKTAARTTAWEATLSNALIRPVQLGGKATVGRGRCRLVLSGVAQ